ncbi:MAG: protein kinase [Acidobacteriia bacterium]|nr:protein kinase [Terriglobia bacterium]
MEYVEGAPLRGPLPPEEAVRLSLQIIAALQAAHGKGIVHRDLKPGNILVTPAGVKLLDFGLAKVAQDSELSDSAVTETNAGTILGTAAYMSPEQAEGKQVDARSDIFSFGAVLYEMLSGKRAFTGDSNLSTMSAVLRDEPAPLPMAPEMAQVIKRCLRKTPAQRFQTVAEVRDALEAARGAGPIEKPPSIAVLPFTNMSGDKENEYFSDGLAEEIINALTKIPGLKVAARTSAFAFKGKNDDIRKIGETLGMAHILEGSVRKAGSRVRITAQLIAVADGCHLWSDRYDREMTDIFAVQDEISQAIVDVLKVHLSQPNQPIVRRKTSNLAAYQAYLEGRYQFQHLTAEGVARGIEFFERAIQADPRYAAPHAELAQAYIYLTLYEPTPLREVIPKAMAASERAIRLDPGEAGGYAARGFVLGACEYQWKTAGADFERAVELDPESPTAHYRRGFWNLMPLGRTEEALVEIQCATQLDPLSMLARGVEAWVLAHAGRSEAVPRARSVIELFPASFLRSFLTGGALAAAGAFEEAEASLRDGLQVAPDNAWLMAILSIVQSRRGNQTGVSSIRSRLEELSGTRYIPSATLGVVHVAAGDAGLGYQWLDKALEERSIWTVPLVQWRPVSQALPGPRLDALLRKMNLA